MKKLSWRSRAIGLVAVAALAAGMGAAYAAIPDAGVIHACYQVNGKGDVDGGSNLRVIDSSSTNKDGQACKKNEKALDWNQQGAKGDKGDKGDPGPQGPAWTPAYGIAQVNVTRNTSHGIVTGEWASYSTTLGSPAARGDSTGGSFRFTCSATPCSISVKAMVSGATGAYVYPRLLIYKEGLNDTTQTETYCEYADGINNLDPPASYQLVGNSFDSLTLGVGGSLDCPGTTQTASPQPAPDGKLVVSQIEVPVGYYDVHSTFYFIKQS